MLYFTKTDTIINFKIIFSFLIISFLCFDCYSQSKLDVEHFFKVGVKALNNGEYKFADSLFTQVIESSPDAPSYVNRAIARKALGDPIGYCKDLESASYKGDEEAEKVLIKDCCLVDTLYRHFIFGELKPDKDIYKVIRIRNRATKEVTEKLFDTNGELFYKMNIHNGDTSIFGPGVQMAQYPGGEKAFFKMLNERLQIAAINKKLAGTHDVVHCSFIIDKDGSVINVKVTNGISKEVDEEVLKVINNMPKWEPTQCGGKSFKLNYYLPIRILFHE